ncbi:hypothetical protein U1Q18_049870 [Sarracenia purpurea var. burkii]
MPHTAGNRTDKTRYFERKKKSKRAKTKYDAFLSSAVWVYYSLAVEIFNAFEHHALRRHAPQHPVFDIFNALEHHALRRHAPQHPDYDWSALSADHDRTFVRAMLTISIPGLCPTLLQVPASECPDNAAQTRTNRSSRNSGWSDSCPKPGYTHPVAHPAQESPWRCNYYIAYITSL